MRTERVSGVKPASAWKAARGTIIATHKVTVPVVGHFATHVTSACTMRAQDHTCPSTVRSPLLPRCSKIARDRPFVATKFADFVAAQQNSNLKKHMPADDPCRRTVGPGPSRRPSVTKSGCCGAHVACRVPCKIATSVLSTGTTDLAIVSACASAVASIGISSVGGSWPVQRISDSKARCERKPGVGCCIQASTASALVIPASFPRWFDRSAGRLRRRGSRPRPHHPSHPRTRSAVSSGALRASACRVPGLGRRPGREGR